MDKSLHSLAFALRWLALFWPVGWALFVTLGDNERLSAVDAYDGQPGDAPDSCRSFLRAVLGAGPLPRAEKGPPRFLVASLEARAN